MLIDVLYFFGDIPVGQLSDAAVKDKVQMIIDHREPEYLEAVLGHSVYTEFMTGVAMGPVPQKWIDLRDGKDYTDIYGRAQKWKGLIRVGSKVKRSPIAYYVYYWYLRGEASKHSGTGESIPNTQNAMQVSPKQKQVTAWNEMFRMNMELKSFLEANRDVYAGWDSYDLNHISRRKFFTKISTSGI